jgi:hypothetical protein
MHIRQFAATVGFAFVVCWITLSFGWAILALLGAAAAYTATVLLERRLDLADLQRFAGEHGFGKPRRTPPTRVR